MSLNFLLCSERSGSNFITNLIGSHSKICGPATKHLISPIARNEFRFRVGNDSQNWNEFLKLVCELMNCGFSSWYYTPTVGELKKLVGSWDVKSLIETIFISEAELEGKRSCFIKENLLYEFFPFIDLNFPDSKFVYQVRDPRDVALSWKRHTGHLGGVVHAAKSWQWEQQNFLSLEYNLKRKSKSKVIRVSYEELVRDTELVCNRILKHLGESFEPEMLAFHKHQLREENSSKEEAWGNLSKPIMRNNFGKFATELSTHEIKLVERICFSEMIHLGYKPIHSWEELSNISAGEIIDVKIKEANDFKRQASVGANEQRLIKEKFYNFLPNE